MVLLYRDSKGKFTGSGHIAAVTSTAVSGNSWMTIGGNEGNAVRYGMRKRSQPSFVGFVDLFQDKASAARVTAAPTSGQDLDVASTR
jgi:hypothetical protein